MGYVGQLSDALEPLREVLRRAGESAATAPTNRAVHEKLHAQLATAGVALENFGQMVSRVLMEIDVETGRSFLEEEIEGEHIA